jgi:hypothetical protein
MKIAQEGSFEGKKHFHCIVVHPETKKEYKNTDVFLDALLNKILSFKEDDVLALWVPPGVLHPRVVVGLPAPQTPVAVKALHFVADPCEKRKNKQK